MTMNEFEGMAFEAAFAELEETVRRLEEGNLSLEESIALFERGQRLAAYCSAQLDNAELRIRQILPSGASEYAERIIAAEGSDIEGMGE
jgi:exodeoxyribonuclease VII small subunit